MACVNCWSVQLLLKIIQRDWNILCVVFVKSLHLVSDDSVLLSDILVMDPDVSDDSSDARYSCLKGNELRYFKRGVWRSTGQGSCGDLGQSERWIGEGRAPSQGKGRGSC